MRNAKPKQDETRADGNRRRRNGRDMALDLARKHTAKTEAHAEVDKMIETLMDEIVDGVRQYRKLNKERIDTRA